MQCVSSQRKIGIVERSLDEWIGLLFQRLADLQRSPVFNQSAVAIKLIGQQGKPDLREMHSILMMSASQRMGFHERVASKSFQDAKACLRGFCSVSSKGTVAV